MAFSASSPRRIASSDSNSVTPRPLPVSRLMSISIFAPSSPSGVSSDSTELRTRPIASSTRDGSLSNVATRAYMLMLLSDEAYRVIFSDRAGRLRDGVDAGARIPQAVHLDPVVLGERLEDPRIALDAALLREARHDAAGIGELDRHAHLVADRERVADPVVLDEPPCWRVDDHVHA